MTCDEIQLALVEGKRGDFGAHLATCEECRFVAAMSRGFASTEAGAPDVDAIAGEGPLLGRYVLECPLGRGGQGVVFRARDLEGDEVVAVKIVNDGGAAEVVNAHRVHHPSVCRVYHSERRGRLRVIVMELIDGKRLTELLPLSLDRALPMFREIAAAVHAAHEAGVLHLDLKPDNVLIRADGRPVVTDFGLSIKTTEGSSGRAIGGTTAFMAPEAQRGDAVDRRADIFSLGVVLEQLTRERTRWLHRAIDRATARDPSARPATALALSHLIDIPARRRRLVRRAAIALGALVVALALAFFLVPPPAGRRAEWHPELWGPDRFGRDDWNVALAAIPEGPPFACARSASELVDRRTTYSDWEHGWAFAGTKSVCVSYANFPQCGTRDPAAETCTLPDGSLGQREPATDCSRERAIVIELGDSYEVTGVRAWYHGYSQVPTRFRIEIDNGDGFHQVFATRENTKGLLPSWEYGGGSIGASSPVATELAPVTARRVRLAVDPCSTRNGQGPGDVVWLYEIEVLASLGRATAWRRALFD